MDPNSAPHAAISHRYFDDITILHHYNKLVSFFCITKILYNFNE